MALRDELLNPIAGANPGGIDLLEDPIYLKLKEARREDDALPQGDWERKRKTADHGQVIKLASEALAKKSKDLWVAAWLTEAVLRRDGLGGLGEGLELLHAMLEQFWDHLYPELEDGDPELRAAPLSWVGIKLENAVKSVPLNKGGHSYFDYQVARSIGYEADLEKDPNRLAARQEAISEGKVSPEEFDQAFASTPKPFYKQLTAGLTASLQSLAALDQFSEEKFGEVAPNYRTLQQALMDVQDIAQDMLAKKLETDPDPPELETEAAAAGAAAAAGGPQTISVEPASAADAAARIGAAARFLQTQDPTSPASYLLLRGYRWGELRAKGSDLDPRLLSAPPTEMRTRLKGLLLDQKWDQLLGEAERVMATPHGRGWLDLQRYVLTACYKLGSEYDHVAAAILSALTALLRDLPQLPDLTMMDDTPTANEETRAWLRDSGILERAAAEAPARPMAAAGEPGRSVYDRAMVEVRGGRAERGIEILMAEVDREKSERARFLRRAEIAGIMVELGREGVALPILKELREKIESHQLENWEEGAVVARPLGLLYRCMGALGEPESNREDLYLRICRLDPVQALSMKGSAGAGSAEPAGQANAAPPRVVDLSADESVSGGSERS
ncbi:MAG TPA: type VI secretion system protein TssA [Gemmatimonadota bacterium]|nr:type VI secretion system protein TssA [Gemmatimonadota bacterium]